MYTIKLHRYCVGPARSMCIQRLGKRPMASYSRSVACANLKQLTKQPMKEDFKRYVDQITQNVIALLHICHLKNLNQDLSYRSVKIKKSRCVVESFPVCVAEP